MKTFLKSAAVIGALSLANTASAVVIDFTGGTVYFNGGGTAVTNNSSSYQNVARFEDQGFKMEFSFDGTPTAFASIAGDYYGTGNDVLHFHWADGPFGEVTELRISRIDGAAFSLGGFRVSTNTSNGGGASTGTEQVFINTSAGTEIFEVQPDNWGLGSGPDPLITIDPANTLFQNITWFSFTNGANSTAVGLGLDNFFLNEQGDPNGSDPTPNNSVPEPGVLALFGLGMLGLGFSRRRQSA